MATIVPIFVLFIIYIRIFWKGLKILFACWKTERQKTTN